MSAPAGHSDDGGLAAPVVEIASSCVLVLASLVTLFWLIPSHTNASAASYDVSPAFIPLVSAYMVLALSAIHLALSLRRYGAGRAGAVADPRARHILIDTTIWLVICVAIQLGLAWLGFLVVGPAAIAGGLYFAGQRNWWVITALAIVIPVLIDFAAWQVFTVDLP